MLIPKVFHRIWLGDQPMPAEFEDFGKTWARLHPEWQFVLWTDRTMPPLRNQELYEQSRTFAAKSNVARYEILQRFGGVYIDTDFECLRPIDGLLANVDCFAALERDITKKGRTLRLINNAIIGAVPGHAFLEDLVAELDGHARALPVDAQSVVQSGPYYFSKIILRHPSVTIFPQNWFYPYEWHERWRRYESFDGAFAVHHWTLSAKFSSWPAPIQLGNSVEPCATVVVFPFTNDAGVRLEWLLEGLCVQTVSNFEVVLVVTPGDVCSVQVAQSFEKRLSIKYSTMSEGRPNLLEQSWRIGLASGGSVRTIHLPGDCVPDADFVRSHALFVDQEIIVCNYVREFSASKVYQYRPPVEYTVFRMHGIESSALNRSDPMAECFSVPTRGTAAVFELGHELANISSNQDLGILATRLCH